MFKILAVSMVALTFSAFAEDSVCYKATAKAPKEVPSVLCLESIYEANQPNMMNVDSKNQTIPFTLNVTEFTRHNEERYKFTAEYEYVNFEDRTWHCGDAREVKLVIAGKNNYGTIDAKELSVKVTVTESRDVCHDYGQTTEIKYELVK